MIGATTTIAIPIEILLLQNKKPLKGLYARLNIFGRQTC